VLLRRVKLPSTIVQRQTTTQTAVSATRIRIEVIRVSEVQIVEAATVLPEPDQAADPVEVVEEPEAETRTLFILTYE
jgi:hypothetical protein